MARLADALRELQKAADALAAADRHFQAEAEANAALHLAEPRPNPLAAKVATQADAARRFLARFEDES